MPQYIAISNGTSCTCAAVQLLASAPLACTRDSAGRLLAAVIASTYNAGQIELLFDELGHPEGRDTCSIDTQRSLRPRV